MNDEKRKLLADAILNKKDHTQFTLKTAQSMLDFYNFFDYGKDFSFEQLSEYHNEIVSEYGQDFFSVCRGFTPIHPRLRSFAFNIWSRTKQLEKP